jgi:hypothetical protein
VDQVLLNQIRAPMLASLTSLPFSPDMFLVNTSPDKAAHYSVVAHILSVVPFPVNEVDVIQVRLGTAHVKTPFKPYSGVEPSCQLHLIDSFRWVGNPSCYLVRSRQASRHRGALSTFMSVGPCACGQ